MDIFPDWQSLLQTFFEDGDPICSALVAKVGVGKILKVENVFALLE